MSNHLSLRLFSTCVLVVPLLLGSFMQEGIREAMAAETGELIRLGSSSAVYYVAGDGNRYVFPNSQTYFTWYEDFSDVRIVSQAEMNVHPLAGTVTYRPGTRWVKIQSDPRTYVVALGGVLRWIEDESVARDLGGDDWAERIDDVPDTFFSGYETGTPISSAEQGFEGMLFLGTDGETYLIRGGERRLVTETGYSANRLQERFLLPSGGLNFTTLALGQAVTGREDALTDASQQTVAEEEEPETPDEEEEEKPGDVDVIDPTVPPSMTLAENAEGVHVATFRLTALLESLMVQKVTLVNCLEYTGATCTEPGDDSVIERVAITYLNEDGQAETQTGFFNNGIATFSNVNFFAPRDEGSILSVSVDTAPVAANQAVSGAQIRLGITSAGGDTFEAVGMDSGNSYTGIGSFVGLCAAATSNTCLGNIMTIRRSAPMLALAANSPSGPGFPGYDAVMRFTVSAGAGGEVVLQKVLFRLSSTDNASTAWNACGNGAGGTLLADETKWTLYDENDMQNPLPVSWTFRGSSGTDCGTNAEQLVYAEADLSGATLEEIGSGSSKTYVLYADTLGASSLQDDAIRVDIPTQTSVENLGLDALLWLDDAFSGTQIDGSLVEGLPVIGGTITY